jgi:hypothetical protein
MLRKDLLRSSNIKLRASLVQMISKMRVSARKSFIDATLPCGNRTRHVVGRPADPA